MTKKRFNKLCRAYFTRLNEWAKATGNKTMDMGDVYKRILNPIFPDGLTRAEWWAKLTELNDTFGVGVKEVRR